MTTYDDQSSAHEKMIVLSRLKEAGDAGIPIKWLRAYSVTYRPNMRYTHTRVRLNLYIKHGVLFLYKPIGLPNSNSTIMMIRVRPDPMNCAVNDYTVYANGDVYNRDSKIRHCQPYQWWFADQPTPKHKRYLPLT